MFPTRFDLDKRFGEYKVVLRKFDGHAMWVNTRVQELAYPLPATNPMGGEIIRFLNGTATGVLIDTAMALVERYAPSTDQQDLLIKASRACSEQGITSVGAAGLDTDAISVVMKSLDQLSIRIYAMLHGPLETRPPRDWCSGRQIEGKDSKDKVWLRAVKLYVDGSLGSRGAALVRHYSDDNSTSGLLMYTQEELNDEVLFWKTCGYQVNAHCIGDKANQMLLDAFSKLGNISNLRLRSEHAQVVLQEDVDRFEDLGVIISTQSNFVSTDWNLRNEDWV